MEDSIRHLERAIEKHEAASLILFSSLADCQPEEVAHLIDEEFQARKRAIVWVADLAEKCTSTEEIFFWAIARNSSFTWRVGRSPKLRLIG